MAVKNLQTVALCVADQGVVVTGTCMDWMRLEREFPAPLSLPRLPRPGYPIRPADAELRADNAAAAQAVTRTGRSERVSARHSKLSKRFGTSLARG